ncbi:hypothetical protein M434DRAFT_30954 [Hypoxylon sp. CO27-5]|nr:hypothetical protein M434DRAFT_30954 [Hypoxylon sp. CO27-5]
MSGLIEPLSAARIEAMGKTALESLPGQPFSLRQRPPLLPFTCTRAPYDSNAPCNICYDYFFPCSYRVSDNQAKRHTTELSEKVAEDFQYLKEIVSENADAILSRWRNKTREKRLELLNEIADLCPEQDALRHLFSNEIEETEIEELALKYIDTWYLPYLDSKTLSDTYTPMMALLYHRSNFSPSDWAIYDLHQIIYAKLKQVMPVQFNPHCIDFTAENYGEMVDWDPIRAHRHQIIGYGKGLLVLTAQAKVLSLLRRFTDKILGEIGGGKQRAKKQKQKQKQQQQQPLEGGNQGSKWEQLISSDFIIPSGSGGSKAVSYVQRPVGSLPTAFDPFEIFDTVNSIYNAEADELYLMQTDPQHVLHVGTQLSIGDFPDDYIEDGRWILIASEVVTATALRKFWWETLRDQVQKLRDLYIHLLEKDTEDVRLRYDCVLVAISATCTKVLGEHIYFIKNFLDLSPAFSEYYEWANLDETSIGSRPRPSLFQNKLCCSLHCLYDDPLTSMKLDPNVYLTAFHREFLSAGKQQQHRVGPTLLRLVGYASTLDDIHASINCMHGYNRAAMYDMASQHGKEATEQEFVAQQIKTLFTERQWPKGKKSVEWLGQVKAARDALDQIWIAFEEAVLNYCKDQNAPKHFVNRVKESLSARDSEQYRLEKQAEEEQVQQAIQEKVDKGKQREKPRLQLQPQLQQPEPSAGHVNRVSELSENLRNTVLGESSTRKPKTKTHGQPYPSPPEEAQGEQSAATEEKELERIVVSALQMQLLEQMFPEPGETPGSRSFRWQLFVEIMVVAGFELRQKNGSAVSFRHADRGGSIVFHKPHPQPVIDHIMLSTMGKRLNKWYGWDRDLFVSSKNFVRKNPAGDGTIQTRRDRPRQNLIASCDSYERRLCYLEDIGAFQYVNRSASNTHEESLSRYITLELIPLTWRNHTGIKNIGLLQRDDSSKDHLQFIL